MRGHQEHSLFRPGTKGMGTDRGGRGGNEWTDGWMDRESVRRETTILLIADDKKAGIFVAEYAEYSDFLKYIILPLGRINARLYEKSLAFHRLFFLLFSPFPNYSVSIITVTDGDGHCSILVLFHPLKRIKVYTNKESLEKSYPILSNRWRTKSRKSSSKPRRKRGRREEERD